VRREVISGRDGRFQVLASLLTSRSQRHRRGLFVVHGVQAVSQATASRWPVQAVVCNRQARVSRWAGEVLEQVGAEVAYELDPDLMAELSDREEPSELLLVARIPKRDYADLERQPSASGPTVICCLDRIQSPGNLGSIIRSADALGVDGLVLLGHSADPYDPRSVRASTGSVFSVPILSAPSADEAKAGLVPLCSGARWLGADETGRPIGEIEAADPVVLVMGSEGRGLSRACRDVCDELVAIPMTGTASSLNVSVAAGILFHALAGHRRDTVLEPNHQDS
jgi:23S rRNA (uridine2479-2'-O)-methyltransferase